MLTEQSSFLIKYAAKSIASATIGRLADRLQGKPTRFLILTNGRTGSNLLVSYLRQSPNVRMYGEILGPYYIQQPYLRNKISKEGPEPYLRSMYERTFTESHIGTKILYGQLSDRYADRIGIPDLHRLEEHLSADRGLHIIHLLRQNLLDVAISIVLARQTQHTNTDYGDAVASVPVEWYLSQFRRIESEVEKYRQLFSEHPYLEIRYEDLAREPKTTIETMCAFLNLPLFGFEVRQRRQRNRKRHEVIQNYDELKAMLAATTYARFFEDEDVGDNPIGLAGPT